MDGRTEDDDRIDDGMDGRTEDDDGDGTDTTKSHKTILVPTQYVHFLYQHMHPHDRRDVLKPTMEG